MTHINKLLTRSDKRDTQWALKGAVSEFGFFGRRLLVRVPAVCLDFLIFFYFIFPCLFDSYLCPLGEQMSFPHVVTVVGATRWSAQMSLLDVLWDSEISSISEVYLKDLTLFVT